LHKLLCNLETVNNYFILYTENDKLKKSSQTISPPRVEGLVMQIGFIAHYLLISALTHLG